MLLFLLSLLSLLSLFCRLWRVRESKNIQSNIARGLKATLLQPVSIVFLFFLAGRPIIISRTLRGKNELPFSAHTLVFNSPKHGCFNAEFDTNTVKTRV